MIELHNFNESHDVNMLHRVIPNTIELLSRLLLEEKEGLIVGFKSMGDGRDSVIMTIPKCMRFDRTQGHSIELLILTSQEMVDTLPSVLDECVSKVEMRVIDVRTLASSGNKLLYHVTIVKSTVTSWNIANREPVYELSLDHNPTSLAILKSYYNHLASEDEDTRTLTTEFDLELNEIEVRANITTKTLSTTRYLRLKHNPMDMGWSEMVIRDNVMNVVSKEQVEYLA